MRRASAHWCVKHNLLSVVQMYVKVLKLPQCTNLWHWFVDSLNLLSHVYSLHQKTLIYNPAKRISAKSALKHSYFDDLDKTTLPAAENV